MLAEGLVASNSIIYVSTVTPRVHIGTTSYTGGIPGVNLYISSNVVISSGPTGGNNFIVLYATGSVMVRGSSFADKLRTWTSSTTQALWNNPSYVATPQDTSAPTIDEGFKIVTATMTVASTANTVIAKYNISVCEPVDNCTTGVVCVYEDTTLKCCEGLYLGISAGALITATGQCAFTPASAASHYYTVTVGDNGGTCLSFNGCTTALYGGKLTSSLLIEELAP